MPLSLSGRVVDLVFGRDIEPFVLDFPFILNTAGIE